MRLSGQKEFVIRFTGPFAKVENLTVISTSFLKKFTGQIVTIENSTVILEINYYLCQGHSSKFLRGP